MDENIDAKPDTGGGKSRDRLERVAAEIGVSVARRHIFLCCDQTEPKCCERDRSLEAW
jgi:hypothetical protein